MAVSVFTFFCCRWHSRSVKGNAHSAPVLITTSSFATDEGNREENEREGGCWGGHERKVIINEGMADAPICRVDSSVRIITLLAPLYSGLCLLLTETDTPAILSRFTLLSLIQCTEYRSYIGCCNHKTF